MKRWIHPRRVLLQRWLDDDPTVPARVGEHIANCERCARVLEEMAMSHPDRVDLDTALRSVFDPPEGMTDRVMRTIAERERADREMNLLLEILAIPTDAANLMLPNDTDTETQNGVEPDGVDGEDRDGPEEAL